MTTDKPDDLPQGAEQVSAAYRSARFDEAPPAELDRTILDEAARSSRRPLSSFLPPLAVAATIVLSVSLVLRSGVFNETSEVPAEGALSDAPGSVSPATITIERDRDTLPTPVVEDGVAVPPEAPQPAAEEQRARTTAPAVRQEALEAELLVQPMSVDSQALESAAFAAPFDCTDVDRNDPEEWIACIEAGAEAGYFDMAFDELDAFGVAYPDYALPQTLESLRAR